MKKCNYCGKEFISLKSLNQHQHQWCSLYKKEQKYKLQKEYDNFKFICDCGKKCASQNSLKGHKSKCAFYINKVKNIRNEILTYEYLYQQLIENDYTANHTARLLNNNVIDVKIIISYAKKFNIRTKTIKEATNNKHTREKYEVTCIEKYGTTNTLSKNTPGYNKRNNTVVTKYGVNNVFQLNSIKKKSQQTLLKNYGVKYPVYISNRYKNNGRKSKIHIIIENILIKYNQSIDSEKICNFNKYNSYLNREYNPRPDIIIENKKIVIEINGDYWHANPIKYKKSDIICRWTGNIQADEIWKFDKSRINQIKSFGYDVIVLWEYDIKHKLDYIEELICKKLGLNQLKN